MGTMPLKHLCPWGLAVTSAHLPLRPRCGGTAEAGPARRGGEGRPHSQTAPDPELGSRVVTQGVRASGLTGGDRGACSPHGRPSSLPGGQHTGPMCLLFPRGLSALEGLLQGWLDTGCSGRVTSQGWRFWRFCCVRFLVWKRCQGASPGVSELLLFGLHGTSYGVPTISLLCRQRVEKTGFTPPSLRWALGGGHWGAAGKVAAWDARIIQQRFRFKS